MNLQTIFKAYQMAEMHKARAVERRGIFGNNRFGIACNNDLFALRWQRYDRLSRRIEARINGEKVCPICIAGGEKHYWACPRYEKPDTTGRLL